MSRSQAEPGNEEDYPSSSAFICGFILLLAACAAAAHSDDWPQFRGPNRNGISTETGLLQTWPEGGPSVLWRNDEIGHGWSSVAVVGGTVYTSGVLNEFLTVTSLDSAGKVRWQKRLCRATGGGGYKGSRSTPTIDGDRLYILSGEGGLYCLNTADGEGVWAVNLVRRYGNGVPTWSLAESVLIDGDRVLCAPAGRVSMVALDKMTGKHIWAARPVDSKAGYASAILFEYDGLRQIVTFSARSAFGVNADTGKLLWKTRRPGQRYGDVMATSAVFSDGLLFVTSGYGAGSAAYKMKVYGKKTRKVRLTKIWATGTLDNHFGGVVLLAGRIIGTGHSSKGLIALDLKTGRGIYRNRDFGGAGLVYADGRLICQGHRGEVALVDPASGWVISSFLLGNRRMVWALPALSDGLLYIRNGSELICYDIRAQREAEDD